MPDLSGTTAIVTGGNSGIGYVCCKASCIFYRIIGHTTLTKKVGTPKQGC